MREQTLGRLIAKSFDPRHLELILLPTERCNFRCTYCYEDFKQGKMQRRVVEAIKLLLSARIDDLESLHLSWFGGEPLLAKDVILELNNFAKQLYIDKKYLSSITTNGFYLNQELFYDLVASGMRHFQISLDGPEADHDRTRVTARGNGTFNAIWKNLVGTKKSANDFEIVLRVHVSADNFRNLPLLIDQILDEFSRDRRYSIFIKEITKLGGPNDDQITPLSQSQITETIISIKEKCAGLIRVNFDDNDEIHVCYASQLNSLLIRSDGRIGKCTVALNDDDNIVGILNNNGSMTLDREKLMLWTAGLFTRNEKQLGCPLAFKNQGAGS